MIKYFSPRAILKIMRFWPPFLASGISIESINDDFTEIVVKMVQRKTNTNYVGSHFGGSLYSMCDPFFMFILLHHMKDEHIVWDQAAKIEFLRPGKGTVRATFKLSLEEIEKVKQAALDNFSYRPTFETEIIDSSGNIVSRVQKTLYVRRKDAKNRYSLDK